MSANIEVEGETKAKVLTVPVESVFQRDEGEIVFVKKAVIVEDEKKKDDKDKKD